MICDYLIYQQIIGCNLCSFTIIYEKVTSNCCPKILDISLIKIMKCIHLKQKMNRTFYCKTRKEVISISECNYCKFKEYKKYKRLQAKTEYKYKPKKGKCGRYYNNVSIMPPSKQYFTKKTKGCEKHHIFGGVANRPKSEQYGLFVWMTEEQHRHYTEHPLENQKLKKTAQAAFMHHYNKSTEEFIDIFGRSWT